ncbi:hypothetical protein IJ182_07300 [bacterium]|nr:hypothetical protein [bacterium]
MSFGINGPDNIPAIQKAQSMFNNGGGGNLGYFKQEKKKKQQEKEEQDVFELSSMIENNDEEENNEFSLDEIGSKIKNFWMKIHSKEQINKNNDENK